MSKIGRLVELPGGQKGIVMVEEDKKDVVLSQLDKDTIELEKLRTFYKDVALLTIDHDVLHDSAVVYPSKLGPVLEKVDKEWWKIGSYWTSLRD